MTDISQKYPLTQKAQSEVRSLFNILGAPASQLVPLENLQKSAFAVIDQTIDGSDQQKEALMVGTVFVMAPPYIFDESERFAKDYNQEVQAIVDQILNPGTTPTADLSRIACALSVASLQDFAAHLKAGKKLEDEITVGIQQMAADLAAKKPETLQMIAALNAPKLQALFEQNVQDLITLLNSQPKAPTPKKPGGPGAI